MQEIKTLIENYFKNFYRIPLKNRIELLDPLLEKIFEKYDDEIMNYFFDYNSLCIDSILFAVIQKLENYNFDIHYRDEKLLWMALCSHDIQTAKYLVANGANLNVCMKEGEYAVIREIALKGDLEILNFLEINGIDLKTCHSFIVLAVMGRHKEFIKYLVRNGYKFNENIITLVINDNWEDVIELLIEHGADVHYNNDTALMIAIMNRYPKIVKVLLDNGARTRTNLPKQDNDLTKICDILKDHGTDNESIINLICQ